MDNKNAAGGGIADRAHNDSAFGGKKINTGTDMTEKLLKRAKRLLAHISRLPLIGGIADDMLDFADMVKDYRDGIYTAVPKKSISAVIGVLIYFTSPVDIVLDIIPVAGWVDDIAVIFLAYKRGLSKDLEAYRLWKKENVYAEFTVESTESADIQTEKKE